MAPNGLETTIVDYVWHVIKLVAVVCALGALIYVVMDVYNHVWAIDGECRRREDMARLQARDLLGTFCEANPYDHEGLCASAHRRLHVDDYSHRVRDCRTDQMMDHRFFSRDVIVDVISHTSRGVLAVFACVLVILYIFGKLGTVAGDVVAVARNYSSSKTAGLPTVLDAGARKTKTS
jgi:hypothetical protein